MKLITTSIELEKEFKRLIRKYNELYWATAWASSSSNIFCDLIARKDCIKKIVVGIHFYQTHPNFIEAFLNNKKVHFIMQPEGTFHPKIYLFYESNDNWELILGSANFTNEAFTRNTEASILLSNKDSDATELLNKSKTFIEKIWEDGVVFSKKDLDNYRIAWENQRQKIKSLSGLYGNNNSKRQPKPIHEVEMITRNWSEFMDKVKSERHHYLNDRLRVINISEELFKTNNHFKDMKTEARKFIAGIPNELNIEGSDLWGYFGSMKGAGIFKHKIIENDLNISKALDEIPLNGQITKTHYENFLKHYTKAFSGNYLATCTRLLTMKRPDTFVCLDSKNKSKLCKDFGIIQQDMDYDRYWEDVIERIYDSEWWKNPKPKNNKEIKVSTARAAFLDSLYYEE